MYNINELEAIARKIRGKLIEMHFKGQAPHLGSSLSCVDILVALYWAVMEIVPKSPDNPGRDFFILSKGHAATALYATLAYRGFFPESLLDTFNKNGASLTEHPSPNCVSGIEVATGSLGHGLSISLGMALAHRIRRINNRFYVLLSDGECNEGSVWEAALFAPRYKLTNVVAIIDYNKWQATGRSNEIMNLSPLIRKWEDFGWNGYEIDGHDLDALVRVLKNIPDGSDKSVVVVAHTVKGKGVSFMEDDNNWHYRIPTGEEVESAHKELGLV